MRHVNRRAKFAGMHGGAAAGHLENCMNGTNTDTIATDAGQPAWPDPGSALRQRPPGKEFRYEAPAGDGLSPLQVGAGMIILGLGIAQLLAPRRVVRSTGMHARPGVVRASGALSIASAANIFRPGKPAPLELAR